MKAIAAQPFALTTLFAAETRRLRCRNQMLSEQYPTLTDERINEFDAEDRAARREAWRAGHSHPPAWAAP